MKMLEKKEGVAILYCVLFVVIALITILLKGMFITLLTEFVISMYFLVILLSKNEKINKAFSIMLSLLMLYFVIHFCYGFIKTAVDSNLNWSLANLVLNIGKVAIYLYVLYSLLFRKGKSSRILYFIISGICLVTFVMVSAFSIVNGFILLGIVIDVIYLLMRLLFVRYAYLYKN